MTQQQWIEQSFGARFEQVGKFISGANKTGKGKLALQEVLSGAELGRAAAYFDQGGMKKLAEREALLTGITSAEFDAEAALYAGSGLARRETLASDAYVGGVTATEDLRRGGHFKDLVLSTHERLKARQPVSEHLMNARAQRGFREDELLSSRERELETVARGMFKTRLYQLPQTTEVKAAYEDVMSTLMNVFTTGGDPTELGRLDRLIEELEKQNAIVGNQQQGQPPLADGE